MVRVRELVSEEERARALGDFNKEKMLAISDFQKLGLVMKYMPYLSEETQHKIKRQIAMYAGEKFIALTQMLNNNEITLKEYTTEVDDIKRHVKEYSEKYSSMKELMEEHFHKKVSEVKEGKVYSTIKIQNIDALAKDLDRLINDMKEELSVSRDKKVDSFSENIQNLSKDLDKFTQELKSFTHNLEETKKVELKDVSQIRERMEEIKNEIKKIEKNKGDDPASSTMINKLSDQAKRMETVVDHLAKRANESVHKAEAKEDVKHNKSMRNG